MPENTVALSVQAGLSSSEFVQQAALFRAAHADRYAKLKFGEELSAEDRERQYWSHMQIALQARPASTISNPG